MGYKGMYSSEQYGFQAVYSSIGYVNQSVWVMKLRKQGIAMQKYKNMKVACLNFHSSASTALTDDYHKMLLDITNC